MTDNYRKQLYRNYYSKFNSFISNYNEKELLSLYAHYDRKIYPVIKNFQKECAILELGCGPGFLLDYLKIKGFTNCLGIDISPEQIELAKAKGHNVQVNDVFDFLKNSPEKFDLIFALDFIEHFTKSELIELASLIYKSMNEKGMLIIRTPNGQGLFPGSIVYGDLTHQTVLNPNSLSQLLLQCGFQNFKFLENGPVAKDFKGMIRLFLWKAIKSSLNFIKIIESGGKSDIWTQDFYCIAIK